MTADRPIRTNRFEKNSLIPRRNPSQMSDKINNLRSEIQVRQNFFRPMPSPMNLVADGVDHINIYSFGETDLGQVLSHDSPVKFRHHIFGAFSNVEAFWHYIQSEERDDRLRNMSRMSFQRFKSELNIRMVTNFRAIIMDANYQRIKQNPGIMQAIIDSTLPFDAYYYTSDRIRQRPKYFAWLLHGFEEIRKALKEQREPDFSALLDTPGSDIYEFACPEMKGSVMKPLSQGDGSKNKKKKKPHSNMSSLLKNGAVESENQEEPEATVAAIECSSVEEPESSVNESSNKEGCTNECGKCVSTEVDTIPEEQGRELV
jgi:hypothetical protein